MLRGLVGLAVLVAAAALVHRLVDEVGWSEVNARLAAARPAGVALAASLLALQMGLWSWRLRLAVGRVAREPGFVVVFLSLVGTATLNLLLPFARLVASLLRARHLSLGSEPRQGKRVFFGVVMYEQLAHLVVMSLVTVAGLAGAMLLLGRRGAFVAITVGTIALVLGGIWAWRRHRETLRAWLERLLVERARLDSDSPALSWSPPSPSIPLHPSWGERDAAGPDTSYSSSPSMDAARPDSFSSRGEGLTGTAVESGRTAVRVLLSLAGDRSLDIPNLLLGLGVFAAGVGAQWVVFAALGVSVHPLAVAVTLSLGQAAGVVFGTPGGLGATEAAMIAAFGVFGLGRAEAASAVLLFRGLHYAVVLGIGLPALGVLEAYFARMNRRELE